MSLFVLYDRQMRSISIKVFGMPGSDGFDDVGEAGTLLGDEDGVEEKTEAEVQAIVVLVVLVVDVDVVDDDVPLLASVFTPPTLAALAFAFEEIVLETGASSITTFDTVAALVATVCELLTELNVFDEELVDAEDESVESEDLLSVVVSEVETEMGTT